MIQLVLNSPFLNQDLEQALRYRQAEDPLVLMQDAVVAVVAPEWCERLLGRDPALCDGGRPAGEGIAVQDRDGTRHARPDQPDRRAGITPDLGRLVLIFV